MINGRCLCGSVSIEIDGCLHSPRYCHCANCRKFSGAAYAAWALARTDELTIVPSDPDVTRYHAGGGGLRVFCSSCGSPLWFEPAGLPQFRGIPLGLIDEGEVAKPQMHVWTRSKLAWVSTADDLPQYETYPEKRDRRATPQVSREQENSAMERRVTNIHDATFEEITTPRGETLRQLDLSGDHLGVRIEDLPPGGTSSFHHYHTLEEEHVLVMSGSATLHLGSEEHALYEGDHVCFMAGNPVPHHIENRSSSNFKFLVFGERIHGDTVFYPNGPVMMLKALGGALFTYQERGATEREEGGS